MSEKKYDINEYLFEKKKEKEEELKKIHPNLKEILSTSNLLSKKITSDNSYIGLVYKDSDNIKNKIKADGSFVGFYNKTLKMWYWAWTVAGINRKNVIKIKDLCKTIVELIDENYENSKSFEYADLIRFFYSNSNFYFDSGKNHENINLIVSSLLAISTSHWFISSDDGNDIISYYLIDDIKQLS
jgi:hypothetical protein